jgi:hypothetical protein
MWAEPEQYMFTHIMLTVVYRRVNTILLPNSVNYCVINRQTYMYSGCSELINTKLAQTFKSVTLFRAKVLLKVLSTFSSLQADHISYKHIKAALLIM